MDCGCEVRNERKLPLSQAGSAHAYPETLKHGSRCPFANPAPYAHHNPLESSSPLRFSQSDALPTYRPIENESTIRCTAGPREIGIP